MRNFSQRASRLIYSLAQDEARRNASSQIYPEHVLLALVKMGDGLGYEIFKAFKINMLTYQLSLEQNIISNASQLISTLDVIPQSRRVNLLINIAETEARNLNNNYIGSEHLVIAAICEQDSLTSNYFEKAGITINEVRNTVKKIQAVFSTSVEILPNFTANSQFNEFLGLHQEQEEPASMEENIQKNQNNPKNIEKNSFLSQFTRDITALVREGKTDPVMGREKENMRLIQILSRRTKNNPVLVGEPGVGKTAVIEVFVNSIVTGNVPYGLLKKRVLSLDLAALIAGTKYRGEFEERMKRMMNEIKEDKNIILFIDELHTIIGAGGTEGTMDASNILKPALSRSEIQIIGASTIKEYSRYIEKDTAFERRFQMIKVEEPSDEDTVKILMEIKKKYEDFHNVVYEDQAIPEIVKLSRRYIPEKFLPDKAVDILDEAGAGKKIEEETKPTEISEIETQLNALCAEKTILVQQQNYEQAACTRDKINELKRRLEIFSNYWKERRTEKRSKVTAKDVCKIIANITGIPLEQLDASESLRLVNMEQEMHKTVVGQNEAVSLIAGAVRRNRAGISSGKRPMGSFIFLGPTGVGKTQLAKALAKFLFGSEEQLVRIDMSDYMEKHNASRLVGAPPGYIGYEEGGILTEQIRRNPYSVVLLDEIEKAHPEIFNLLLQLLEEGELCDNLGRKINFRSTVIIMTSNAGARQITQEGRVGFSSDESGILPYEEIRTGAMAELKKILSPELINRIDDIIVFDALNKEQISSILDIQTAELAERLKEKKLSIEISEQARNYLIENGYEPEMGARPMRRLIQKEIEDPLSIEILSGKSENCRKIIVDFSEDKIELKFIQSNKITEESNSNSENAALISSNPAQPEIQTDNKN